MVDTRHFAFDFTSRLLEAVGFVDEQIDGIVFHSENFQALSLIQARSLLSQFALKRDSWTG